MRKLTLLLTVAVVASTAGCGFLTGSEALQISAQPATVEESTLSETGYEEQSVTNQTVSREFTVAGQTRQVNVTNSLARYDRSVDLGPLGGQRAAVFATFSSPQVDVLGQSFNPISDMSNEDILSQFSSQYGGLSVGEQVDNRTHTVLGEETGVEKYEGTAQLSGSSVDVYVHVTTVKHGGDYVVSLAIYPQELSGEEERAFTMLDGIDHADGSDS